MGMRSNVSFKKSSDAPTNMLSQREEGQASEQKQEAVLLYKERKEHPILTSLKIEASRLKNAVTTYPAKGFGGSKNSNFYEFLTMGAVPYITGSLTMIAVFNAANRYFDIVSRGIASKLGKRMMFGVPAYMLFKNISSHFVEDPVKYKYGIDVNLPYKKKIVELPEKRNTKNLVPEVNYKDAKIATEGDGELRKEKKNPLIAYEYHKAYESVDFPRWDLFYGNENFGKDRNSYYYNVGKKMGYTDEELEYSDQKVRPRIKEKVVQTKVFSSLSSYLWAAVGVGIFVQDPLTNLKFNPIEDSKVRERGIKVPFYPVEFMKKTVENYKEFVGSNKASFKEMAESKIKNIEIPFAKKPLTRHIAGRLLLGGAFFSTLLGNFFTLTDFNKYRGSNYNAATPLMEADKEKVVC